MTKQPTLHIAAQDGPHGFWLSSKRATGLTVRGAIRVVPLRLTERFGQPSNATADGKVSGTYVFENDRDGTVALYDWKATALYDARPTANLPATQDFWASPEPAEFTLAASGEVNLIEFARWIGAKGVSVEMTSQWTEL